MYVKLHDSIFGSSIMEEDIEIRYIWMCLLTLADKDGFVDETIPALARRFNVSEKIMGESIETFLSPDPTSRTTDEDGRRIRPIRETFGWQIINYEKYRNMRSTEERRDYMKSYMRKYRESNGKKKSRKQNSLQKTNSKQPLTKLANTDTDTDTKVREYITLTPDEYLKLKTKYPEDRLEWMFDKLDFWATKKKKVINGFGYFKKGSWLLEEMEKHFNMSPKDSGLCEKCGEEPKYLGGLCATCHYSRE